MKKLLCIIVISITCQIAKSQIKNVTEFISWNKLSLLSIQNNLKKDGFKYWQQEKYSTFEGKDVSLHVWNHFDKDSIEFIFGIFLLENKPIALTYISNNPSFFESRKAAIIKYSLNEYTKINNKDTLQEKYMNDLNALMIIGSVIENNKNIIYYTAQSKEGLLLLQIFVNNKKE